MKYRCLLFDLDGTLVDSSGDLIKSMNLTIVEMGLTPLPAAQIMSFVGEGIHLLLERALKAALGRPPASLEAQRGMTSYRRHYSEHLLDETRPYADVEPILEYFALMPKGVVTNKPLDFTLRLLDGLNLSRHFEAIIGGDSLADRKPSPGPVIEAARRCGVEPAHCLMIGDTRIDMEAGRAAGMATCGFIGGFRGRDELTSANADFLIESFAELRPLVEA